MSVGSVIILVDESGDVEDSKFNTSVRLICDLGDMVDGLMK
jgi:hypothetical protein